MFLELRLRISTGRDKNLSMSEWIDRLEERQQYLDQHRHHRSQIFGPMAQRKWEALVPQIQGDVGDLNERQAIRSSLLNGEILINEQSSPGRHEMNLTKLAFPRISLTVTLDSHAQSIRIHQVRQETDEGDKIATNDRLLLHLDNNDQMSVRDRNGKWLETEQVSEYILTKFLEKP
jgi:hypothetical protein